MERRSLLPCAAAIALVVIISAPGFAEESSKSGAERVIKQFKETEEMLRQSGPRLDGDATSALW